MLLRTEQCSLDCTVLTSRSQQRLFMFTRDFSIMKASDRSCSASTVQLFHNLTMIFFIIKQTIEAGRTGQNIFPIMCNTFDYLKIYVHLIY